VKRPFFSKGGFAAVFSAGLVAKMWRTVATVDTVHVSFSRELIPTCATMFALVQHKRLVLQPHGMLTSRSGPKQQVVDVVTKRLYRRAQLIVALTDQERQELVAWCPDYSGEYVVCGNPVPRHGRDKVRGRSSRPVALFAARLHPRKRVQVFVDAASGSQGHNDIQFVVLGPDEGDLPVVLESARKVPNLHYAGAVSSTEVLDRVDRADAFVLTSANEPWGNVLVSALSLGVPVVVAESAALSGLIRGYGAGLVVPDEDAKALRTALETLFGDDDYYIRCSEAALALVRENMGFEAQTKLLHRIYT
jgi:glycosyltransferase involved in cell wall biosynthesis